LASASGLSPGRIHRPPEPGHRRGPNQLAVAEDHRWAGDLASSIARVTAANLGRRMNTGNVRTYPWQGDEGIRYQITLDIRQLMPAAMATR
jgi:uncharacterized lipoprotein YmbA